jgi:GAF domain-containing protein
MVHGMEVVLDPILSEAVVLSRSRMGNIQLFDASSGQLVIRSHIGFETNFLRTFKNVSAVNGCACGRAVRLRKAVIIPDILRDEEYSPYRQAALDAGYRSVTSLPIISEGSLLGVLSVHRAEPGMKEDDVATLSGITEFAASLIARHL